LSADARCPRMGGFGRDAVASLSADLEAGFPICTAFTSPPALPLEAIGTG
jgi:hypothetical protein